MWEIIADPKEYGIEVLEEGLNRGETAFADDDRKKWAEEIGTFASKLTGLAEKADNLKNLLMSEDEILTTPSSLKALKIQFFNVNDALNTALDLADKIENQIVKK